MDCCAAHLWKSHEINTFLNKKVKPTNNNDMDEVTEITFLPSFLCLMLTLSDTLYTCLLEHLPHDWLE